MELQKVSSEVSGGRRDYEGDHQYLVIDDEEEEVEDDGPLPGFRFHPTDEELVSFYLTRKVRRKPISIEIIREVDIYKHDPWDLAKASSVGDKEWYFYCKRGRKYRNSIRPNRVTGSGFWKATGIDRPIYTNKAGDHHHCIGLKKSLVYYRGSAGKGTKTDWMMHEFRLPSGNHHAVDVTAQEAEIWTLCRILKRNRKYTPNWRELSAKRPSSSITHNAMIPMNSNGSQSSNNTNECYISFENPSSTQLHHPRQQQKQIPNYQQQKIENYGEFEEVSRLLMEDDSYLSSSTNTTTTHKKGQWTMTSAAPSSNRPDYSPALINNPSANHHHADVVDHTNHLLLADAYNIIDDMDDLTSVVHEYTPLEHCQI